MWAALEENRGGGVAAGPIAARWRRLPVRIDLAHSFCRNEKASVVAEVGRLPESVTSSPVVSLRHRRLALARQPVAVLSSTSGGTGSRTINNKTWLQSMSEQRNPRHTFLKYK